MFDNYENEVLDGYEGRCLGNEEEYEADDTCIWECCTCHGENSLTTTMQEYLSLECTCEHCGLKQWVEGFID